MRARARNSLLRIRLRPSSDVHKNIPSSLFRRGARTQSTRRRRRRRDCTPVPTRSPRRRRHRSFPACGGVGPVARSRSKKGKCQNLSPAILFWLLFPLLSSLPLELPSPPLPLPSRFPAPKSHHKSALHNSTSRRKRSRGSRIHNIQIDRWIDRYCAAFAWRFTQVRSSIARIDQIASCDSLRVCLSARSSLCLPQEVQIPVKPCDGRGPGSGYRRREGGHGWRGWHAVAQIKISVP